MTPTSPFNMTSPFSTPALEATKMAIPDFSLGPSAMVHKPIEGFQQTIHDVGAPLSPFHYQLRKVD